MRPPQSCGGTNGTTELLVLKRYLKEKYMKYIFRLAITLLASLCFQVKAAPGETLMGIWDLDGSGSAQQVWSSFVRVGVYKIRVESSNGNSYSYYVEAGSYKPNWSLINVSDLNGEPGLELSIMFTVRETAAGLQIISHRNRSSKIHYVLPPTGGLNYSVVTAANLDGNPGNELLLNVAYTNGGREYQVIHMQGTSISETKYPFNRGESVTILNNGIIDTDGQPGAEVLVNVGGNKIYVINDRNRSTYTYYMNGTSWSMLGSSDMNGVAGNEIVISNGAYLHFINDAAKTTKQVYVGNPPWSLYGFANTDGRPGNEAQISINGRIKSFAY